MPEKKEIRSTVVGVGAPPVGNESIGDAIDYTRQNPGGFIAAVQWIWGFVLALFKK